MPVVARRILIAGRVQGVFYRQSCKAQADALGVSGTARNLDDGKVEVLAEGEASAVAALEAWCREGPPRALVTKVEARDVPPPGTTGFVTR